MSKKSVAFRKVAEVALQATEGFLLAKEVVLQIKSSVDAYVEDAGYRHGTTTRRAIAKLRKNFGEKHL